MHVKKNRKGGSWHGMKGGSKVRKCSDVGWWMKEKAFGSGVERDYFWNAVYLFTHLLCHGCPNPRPSVPQACAATSIAAPAAVTHHGSLSDVTLLASLPIEPRELESERWQGNKKRRGEESEVGKLRIKEAVDLGCFFNLFYRKPYSRIDRYT